MPTRKTSGRSARTTSPHNWSRVSGAWIEWVVDLNRMVKMHGCQRCPIVSKLDLLQPQRGLRFRENPGTQHHPALFNNLYIDHEIFGVAEHVAGLSASRAESNMNHCAFFKKVPGARFPYEKKGLEHWSHR